LLDQVISNFDHNNIGQTLDFTHYIR